MAYAPKYDGFGGGQSVLGPILPNCSDFQMLPWNIETQWLQMAPCEHFTLIYDFSLSLFIHIFDLIFPIN